MHKLWDYIFLSSFIPAREIPPTPQFNSHSSAAHVISMIISWNPENKHCHGDEDGDGKRLWRCLEIRWDGISREESDSKCFKWDFSYSSVYQANTWNNFTVESIGPYAIWFRFRFHFQTQVRTAAAHFHFHFFHLYSPSDLFLRFSSDFPFSLCLAWCLFSGIIRVLLLSKWKTIASPVGKEENGKEIVVLLFSLI